MLASFGPRSCGTQSEIEARDFILRKFKRYDLDDVHTEEFEYLGWRRVESRAWIIKPIEKDIEMLSFLNSISTPPNRIEGEIIYINPCPREMFELYKDVIKDNIILTYKYWSNKSPGGYGVNNTTNLASEYGAKALIMRIQAQTLARQLVAKMVKNGFIALHPFIVVNWTPLIDEY